MSPVGRVFTDTHAAMSVDSEAEIFLDDDTRVRILRALFSAYYADKGADVIFDNNRRWTANADLLMTLFPMSRIICCVRDPKAIVDSFERLLRSHPLAVSKIIGMQSNLNVYSRFDHYMSAEGVLGFAYYALRDAFWGPAKDRLLFIEYDDLSRFPKEVLEDLHKVLNLPKFKYDFENIEQLPLTKEFDARIGTPGLHDLKGKVVYEPRTTILPPDIYNRVPGPFWRVNKEATKAP
jgi:sulfotransferase